MNYKERLDELEACHFTPQGGQKTGPSAAYNASQEHIKELISIARALLAENERLVRLVDDPEMNCAGEFPCCEDDWVCNRWCPGYKAPTLLEGG